MILKKLSLVKDKSTDDSSVCPSWILAHLKHDPLFWNVHKNWIFFVLFSLLFLTACDRMFCYSESEEPTSSSNVTARQGGSWVNTSHQQMDLDSPDSVDYQSYGIQKIIPSQNDVSSNSFIQLL